MLNEFIGDGAQVFEKAARKREVRLSLQDAATRQAEEQQAYWAATSAIAEGRSLMLEAELTAREMEAAVALRQRQVETAQYMPEFLGLFGKAKELIEKAGIAERTGGPQSTWLTSRPVPIAVEENAVQSVELTVRDSKGGGYFSRQRTPEWVGVQSRVQIGDDIAKGDFQGLRLESNQLLTPTGAELPSRIDELTEIMGLVETRLGLSS